MQPEFIVLWHCTSAKQDLSTSEVVMKSSNNWQALFILSAITIAIYNIPGKWTEECNMLKQFLHRIKFFISMIKKYTTVNQFEKDIPIFASNQIFLTFYYAKICQQSYNVRNMSWYCYFCFAFIEFNISSKVTSVWNSGVPNLDFLDNCIYPTSILTLSMELTSKTQLKEEISKFEFFWKGITYHG